jgi:hypothetical protein
VAGWLVEGLQMVCVCVYVCVCVKRYLTAAELVLAQTVAELMLTTGSVSLRTTQVSHHDVVILLLSSPLAATVIRRSCSRCNNRSRGSCTCTSCWRAPLESHTAVESRWRLLKKPRQSRCTM